jgi:FKBP-type peptidyl-prolyl cis-trans isomerase
MKKIVYFLFPLIFVSFMSCHDDEDDNGGQWKIDNDKAYSDSIQSGEYTPVEFAGAPAGVYYKVLPDSKDLGTEYPFQTSKVKVRYKGSFYDGTVFDSGSYLTGNPVEFSVSGVIRGFAIALQKMVVGNHWRICIPYKLGYGDVTQGSIPAYSTLIFDVELVEITQYPK